MTAEHRDRANRLGYRIGRRGAILIAFGLTWLLAGQALYDSPPIPGGAELLFEQLPVNVRAAGWVIFGLVAIANAFRRRGSGKDWVGYAALYVMPAIRAVSFLLGWIGSLDHVGGYPAGLRGAVIYLVLLAVLVICSGWREP